MIQSGLSYIHRDHRSWETIGMDIIIDKDLNIKIIEVNSFPAFFASASQEFKSKLIFAEMAIKTISYNLS